MDIRFHLNRLTLWIKNPTKIELHLSLKLIVNVTIAKCLHICHAKHRGRSVLNLVRAAAIVTLTYLPLQIHAYDLAPDFQDKIKIEQASDIVNLSKTTERLITRYLEQSSRNTDVDTINLERLANNIRSELSQGKDKPLLMLNLAQKIHSALPSIRSNIDTNNTALFIRVLLVSGDTKTALNLSEEVFENASYLTTGLVNYHLALHYFEHGDFENAQKYLLSIDANDGLSPAEQDFAQLIFAITLQHQKEHRKAIKVYEKIPSNSPHFIYAKLNQALAYLLQGWWTDAQLAIETALKQDIPKDALDVKNRALLFLAYSQLKHEYYRNARQSLRKISLDSPYVNRALLAMGLAALNQKDYLGAINAFTRLKNSKIDELAKTESHLMIPFTYESMGDINEAEARYTESLAFFANEILSWQKKSLDLREITNVISAVENINFPKHLVRQFRFLNLTSPNDLNSSLRSEFEQTKKAFNDSMRAIINTHHQEQISYIKSYQSQAQFALARLYDDNQ